MTGLYLLLPLLLTILLSFLVVRGGAIALMMTGMDREKASFQALSAFTRAGFTTKEAELVVDNRRRRRIISWLIILGNAGFVAIIVTGTSSIAVSRGYQLAIVIAAIIAGAYALYWMARRGGSARRWEGFVENRLARSRFMARSTVEDLIHLSGGYGLVRAIVTKESPLVGQALVEANTAEGDSWILGVERGRRWISFPESQETIREGDRLVVYGDLDALKPQFQRAEQRLSG